MLSKDYNNLKKLLPWEREYRKFTHEFHAIIKELILIWETIEQIKSHCGEAIAWLHALSGVH